jgi:ABC-2 type transport system ATP-binding protein
VIITTHLMDEAERCQMVGYMRAGRMAAQGSPEEILNQAGLGPRLRLWLAQPEDDAILLQSLGFEAEIDGGVVTVTLKSHAQIKDVLAHISPRDIRLSEPRLEEAFLRLSEGA